MDLAVGREGSWEDIAALDADGFSGVAHEVDGDALDDLRGKLSGGRDGGQAMEIFAVPAAMRCRTGARVRRTAA